MIGRIARGAGGIVLAVAAGLIFLGQKTFEVETIIPAPPQAVWAVLSDPAGYRVWNPVFVRVDGRYYQGADVQTTIALPDGGATVMDSTVTAFVPERELRQQGGTPGLLAYDHQWLLEPVEGGTRVIQREVDRGLYMWFWDSDWIMPAYAAAGEALKARVLETGG